MGKFGLSELRIIWIYQKNLIKYEYHMNNDHKVRKFFYHYKVNKIGLKYGIVIEPNSVDEGMRICHLGSILIRGKIGKNAIIHINTSHVGAGSIDEAPTCGDNLYLVIGATIVGPVNVGDDACVGAGAVVTHDIPNHSIVGGGSCKDNR